MLLERHNLTWLVLPALLRDFVATMASCPSWLFYSLFLALYLGQVRSLHPPRLRNARLNPPI